MSYKPIPGVTVFRHWSEFKEDPNRFIRSIVFRPEEDPGWNYDGCPPYMVAFTSVGGEPEHYLIPPAMAYYAATHQGWTKQGRENIREDGRDDIRSQLKSILNISDNQ